MKQTHFLNVAIFISATLAWAGEAQASRIYECYIGGVKTYVSKPAGNCESLDNRELSKHLGLYTSIAPKPMPTVLSVDNDSRPSQPKRAVSAAPKAQTANNRARTAPVRSAPPLQAAAPAPTMPVSNRPAGSSGRRIILEQELANERNALSSVQNELNTARSQGNQARASQLANSVQDRQQNIQALQRELSRM